MPVLIVREYIECKLYVHEDTLGSTQYCTKSTGQVFEELSYDAWGYPTSQGKLLSNDKGTYITANFTGHPFDTSTDMYFAQARFYDPATRDFISRDPAKDGLNWYAYCADNPATYEDPTGEFLPLVGALIGAGAGFLIGARGKRCRKPNQRRKGGCGSRGGSRGSGPCGRCPHR